MSRGDRHHRWAAEHLIRARRRRQPIVVPHLVVGEAFTALRYDRRVSPRRDARVAHTVFAMVDANPDTFSLIPPPRDLHVRARDLLVQYVDQSFSFVDAATFLSIDERDDVREVLTVDGRHFRAYRFRHPVAVVTPETPPAS